MLFFSKTLKTRQDHMWLLALDLQNHHDYNSYNILASCNFDLKFIYVRSGLEGSAQDSKRLHDALSTRNGL